MRKPIGTSLQDDIATLNCIKAQVFVHTGRKACSLKYILNMVLLLLLLLTSKGKITRDVTNPPLSLKIIIYAIYILQYSKTFVLLKF